MQSLQNRKTFLVLEWLNYVRNGKTRVVIKAKGTVENTSIKFKNVPARQGVFNLGFIEEQNNMLPLRSRREQYLLQNMLGNYPLLKKNVQTKHGIDYISFNKHGPMSHLEREESFAKQIENRNIHRKSGNEVKLPKLEYPRYSQFL